MLGLFAAVDDWTKQVAVHPTKTGQNKRITVVTLALALRDRAGFARIGHHDLHSERVEKSTDPRRMGSCLHDHQGSRVCTCKLRKLVAFVVQRALLQDFSATIEHTKRVSLVTKIKADGYSCYP